MLLVFLLSGCEHSSKKNGNQYEDLISQIEHSQPADEIVLEKIDSLRSLAKSRGNKSALSKSFFYLGRYHYAKKNYPSARQNFLEALKLNGETTRDSNLAIIYDLLGKSYNRLQHRDTARYYFNEGLSIWNTLNDSVRIGTSFNNIGMSFWDGNIYDSAIIYFEKSLAIREKLPDKEDLGYTLNNIGTIYYQWSIYDRALDYYIRSLDIRKELEIKELIPLVLVNIGLVYKETGNPDKAIEYFAEGLAAALVSTDTMATAYSYYAQALIHHDSNRDSAIFYYNKSLTLYKLINHSGGIIICLKGLGEIYLREQKFNPAYDIFSEMLSIGLEENLPLRVAESYRYLGLIAKKKGDEALARDYFIKSIELSKKINVETFLRDSYLNLSNVEELLGNKDASLQALKEYVKLKSTVDNEATKKRLDDLKNQLEFEKFRREQEIQNYENQQQRTIIMGGLLLLGILIVASLFLIRANRRIRKFNKVLQEQNEIIHNNTVLLQEKNNELQQLNSSKDRLFAIIAHDLRNPFFLLINLAEILHDEDKTLTEEERKKHINHLSDVTNKTYYLLENLLNLSASSIGRIPFNPQMIAVRPVIEDIQRLYNLQLRNKQISWKDEIPEDLQVFADPKMVEVIFRNLINNAIKYTNHQGEIGIEARRENGSVDVIVRDNGIGISEEAQKKLFTQLFAESNPGTNGEKGTGLGLSLCNEFVKKNSGRIKVNSEIGKGTAFTITLPAIEINN